MERKKNASRKKHHFIYKTICKVTGKYYIGMHSTDDLGDRYLGSGSYLSRSIKKHGRENHICEILEFHPDRKMLREREAELVTSDLVENQMCMNLRLGGDNGAYGRTLSEETRQKISESHKGKVKTEEHRRNLSKSLKGKERQSGWKHSDEAKRKISESAKKRTKHSMSGRHHTDETRKKMSESQKKSYVICLNCPRRTNAGICWGCKKEKRRPLWARQPTNTTGPT